MPAAATIGPSGGQWALLGIGSVGLAGICAPTSRYAQITGTLNPLPVARFSATTV